MQKYIYFHSFKNLIGKTGFEAKKISDTGEKSWVNKIGY